MSCGLRWTATPCRCCRWLRHPITFRYVAQQPRGDSAVCVLRTRCAPAAASRRRQVADRCRHRQPRRADPRCGDRGDAADRGRSRVERLPAVSRASRVHGRGVGLPGHALRCDYRSGDRAARAGRFEGGYRGTHPVAHESGRRGARTRGVLPGVCARHAVGGRGARVRALPAGWTSRPRGRGARRPGEGSCADRELPGQPHHVDDHAGRVRTSRVVCRTAGAAADQRSGVQRAVVRRLSCAERAAGAGSITGRG